MRNKLYFETNVPVEVALEFAEGRVSEGRYGDQMYYSLEDNQCMYVEMEVADQITKQRIQPGDPFTICKRERKDGRKRSIAWEVQYEGKTAKAAISKVPAPAVATPRQQNTEAHSQDTARAQNTVRGADAGGENLMGMRLALSASITLLAEAEVFAKSKGMALHFSGEDVRAMANCLYIQVSKSTQAPGQFFGLNETAVRQ